MSYRHVTRRSNPRRLGLPARRRQASARMQSLAQYHDRLVDRSFGGLGTAQRAARYEVVNDASVAGWPSPGHPPGAAFIMGGAVDPGPPLKQPGRP